MFHMCFRMYAASVLSRCCICFTQKLQVFHLDVAYFLQWLHMCFLVFQTYVASVSSVFFCMLQVLHLDVSKVDRVLHIWDARGKRTDGHPDANSAVDVS